MARHRLTTAALLIAASVSRWPSSRPLPGVPRPAPAPAPPASAAPAQLRGPAVTTGSTQRPPRPPSRPASPMPVRPSRTAAADREQLGSQRFSTRSRTRRGCWRCRRTSPARKSVAAAYLQAWCYAPADQPANTNITNTAPWMTAAGWADDAARAVDDTHLGPDPSRPG